MKKPYKQPGVKKIALDHKQAILQACVIGGAYFGWQNPGVSSSKCAVTGASVFSCGTSVKGTKTKGAGDNTWQMIEDVQPS